MSFYSPDGDLEEIFLADYDVIDQNTKTGLWLWGHNALGQLGDNTRVNKSSPVQTVAGGTDWKQVSCGSIHSVSIKTDSTLWTWGHNNNGQLGDNTRTHRSSPVQTVAGGTNWKSVNCGWFHTTAIKNDGTLWAWGHNGYGQLGDGAIAHRSSPVQTVAGGVDWKSVSAGSYHTAAIKTDGTLWTWGHNASGQLGDDTVAHKSSPVQTVAEGTNWKQVSCGNYYTTAIKTNGELWLWGANSEGQLGDDTVAHKSSPVQTVAGGTDWNQINCSGTHTAAIKTDGTLWTWGHNSYGQLGDETKTHRSSPVQTVAGGTNWKSINSDSSLHMAAIKTDGTLWTWGHNLYGQLGDNTRTHRSSPIQTIAYGTNWRQVNCGDYFTAAITFQI